MKTDFKMTVMGIQFGNIILLFTLIHSQDRHVPHHLCVQLKTTPCTTLTTQTKVLTNNSETKNCLPEALVIIE